MQYTTGQHDALAKIAEFDHVFCVDVHGNVFEPSYKGYYSPDALDVDPNATTLRYGNEEWQLPLSGLTGQDRYNGPWLHNSEVIPGGVAEVVLSMPGYWVAIYGQHSPEYVDCPFGQEDHDDGNCHCETIIEGWTMAHIPFPQPFTNTARSAA